MTFDWEKAEQEDKELRQQKGAPAGIGLIALAIVTTVLHFAIGWPEDLWSVAFSAGIGVPLVVMGLKRRRTARKARGANHAAP